MGGWRGRDEEVNVAKYVVLVNWTEKGVMEAKATGERAKKFQDMAKSVGASVDTLLWCLGRYDIVSIVDAPDDATIALQSDATKFCGETSRLWKKSRCCASC